MFTLIILLIGVSWAGNLWTYERSQLEEPLFLKHYMTLDGATGEIMKLTFLENRNSNRTVSGIRIDELPMVQFNLNEETRMKHQVIRSASAELDPPLLRDVEGKPLSIKHITVFFNHGEQTRVPIGDIQIVWHSKPPSLTNATSGGSSNDGSGFDHLIVDHTAELEAITYTHNEHVRPWFELKLNNDPVESIKFPLSVRQGDILHFTYKLTIPEDNPAAMDVLYGKALMHFKLPDGQQKIEAFHLTRDPYLSEKQIKKLVRAQRGGER
ncbi:hypothetical protein ACFO9Q_03960 [Paenibacillus sp. GCM10023252]|uniref:hypothetical protein n=1 Tax=Paenibacillus sp. GCM10023252 TaxID=3252649 RepID=UPI003621E6B8